MDDKELDTGYQEYMLKKADKSTIKVFATIFSVFIGLKLVGIDVGPLFQQVGQAWANSYEIRSEMAARAPDTQLTDRIEALEVLSHPPADYP